MNISATARPSLRAELAAATEQRVLAALADLLRTGDEDVTFEKLSAGAGVPLRTLYRYFPSKEALFAAFWPWVNDSIDMPGRPATPREVVNHIPDLFAAFDRDAALVTAMLHHPQGRAVRLANATARQAKFKLALAEVTEELSLVEERSLLAAVTALCSASGWESMKDNWGLSGPAAAEAAQWAVQALIDEARGLSRGRSK